MEKPVVFVVVTVVVVLLVAYDGLVIGFGAATGTGLGAAQDGDVYLAPELLLKALFELTVPEEARSPEEDFQEEVDLAGTDLEELQKLERLEELELEDRLLEKELEDRLLELLRPPPLLPLANAS